MQKITPTNAALFISIIFGAGFLAYGYNLAGFDAFARWFLFLGFIWLVAQYKHWDWFSAIALIVTVIASGLGIWMDFHAGWLIAASIFTLSGWDLTEFRRNTRDVPIDELYGNEQRHIARLSLLASVGLIFASLLLLLRRQFTWDWGIVLLVMAGLSLALFIIGRRTN